MLSESLKSLKYSHNFPFLNKVKALYIKSLLSPSHMHIHTLEAGLTST